MAEAIAILRRHVNFVPLASRLASRYRYARGVKRKEVDALAREVIEVRAKSLHVTPQWIEDAWGEYLRRSRARA